MTKTLPLPASALGKVLERMEIADIAQATIRQSGDIARTLEQESGTEFLHLEMGIPGLPPHEAGVEAECAALRQGVASLYPNMFGIPALKNAASRFVRAFLDVDIAPKGCIPTVGSMQGSFCAFLLSSQLDPQKDTILFIDPGFPVQRSQVSLLNIRSESFDIYEHRAEKLGPKIESYLSTGRIAAIVYSNPNNPAWTNLTDEEYRILARMAEKHDVIIMEDLAYLGMDFRQRFGVPYTEPFVPTVAKYTDRYVLLVSASKIFSYAGQRIAMVCMSPAVADRRYEFFEKFYEMPTFGDAYIYGVLYCASSGTAHSSQYAFAEMMKAAVEGKLDFVDTSKEYGRRAAIAKRMFLENGFHIVYDRDGDQPISDGFFFTVGYRDMKGDELQKELLRYGISTISLPSTGSRQQGVRVCVSMLCDEGSFTRLSDRLETFALDHSSEKTRRAELQTI